MGPLERSSVVIASFPFSDLTESKLRPAVVISAVPYMDWVLCQVTSNPLGDSQSIQLTDDSLAAGSLQMVSYVRPGKLFTADQRLIDRVVARLRSEVFNQLLDAVVNLLNQNRMR